MPTGLEKNIQLLYYFHIILNKLNVIKIVLQMEGDSHISQFPYRQQRRDDVLTKAIVNQNLKVQWM